MKGLLRAIVSIACISVSLTAPAQDEPLPKVGQPSPEFMLPEVFNYGNISYKSTEPSGRWTILDFWATGCPSCIRSFPKLNELQKTFKDQLDIVLVGKTDKYIKKMYEKLKAHYQLDLAYTFDSNVFKILQLNYTPYSMVIDPAGVIRSIPFPNILDSSIIAGFISGKDVKIPQIKDYQYIVPTDDLKKMDSVERLQDSLKGMMFRSELSLAWYNMPTMKGQEDFTKNKWSNYHNNGIDIFSMDLGTLYQIAYTGYTFIFPGDSLFGKMYRQLIVETRDSIKFRPSSLTNPFIYNYSLRVPKDQCNDSFLMKTMRQDLDHYFGYDFKIETRTMPYYGLKLLPGTLKKIRSKGGDSNWEQTNGMTGISLHNQPMSFFFKLIWNNYPLGPEILDETGVTENIDIKVDGMLTDIPSLTKALRKAGFDLVPKQKPMTVMVVRDKNSHQE